MGRLVSISRLVVCWPQSSTLTHFPKYNLLSPLYQKFSTASKPIISSTEHVPRLEYEFIDGVERLERYCPGGYHPVLIGDVLKDGYRVIEKLGYGTYSTIWLSRDEQRAAYVAVKVSTADSSLREADIIRAITESSQPDDQGRAMIPIIQYQFEIKGPNGCHRCYVTSPAQSSVAAAHFSYLFTIETARVVVAQLVLAVAYIHQKGIIHGDIHLGNVLLRLPSSFDEPSIGQFYERFDKPCTAPVVRLDGQPLPPGVPSYGVVPAWLGKKANEIIPSEAHVLLSDFGEAFSPSDPQQKRRGDECHVPLPVLPPEAYFEPDKPLSFSADIWTLACAIWSIIGLRSLFDATLAMMDDMSSQQVDILGPLPPEWWDKWEARKEYFEETGEPKKGRFVFSSFEHYFEQDVQTQRQKDGLAAFDEKEKTAILVMLRRMLAFRPEERATANEVLDSDWMRTWVLPEFKKIERKI